LDFFLHRSVVGLSILDFLFLENLFLDFSVLDFFSDYIFEVDFCNFDQDLFF